MTAPPVNDHRGLRRFPTDLIRCDVVSKSIKCPADEGWLLIEASSEWGQALRRGSQKSGPQSAFQGLRQSSLTCDGLRSKAEKCVLYLIILIKSAVELDNQLH